MKQLTKIILILYIWSLTVFTVFFFPYQVFEKDSKEFIMEHQYLGKMNIAIHAPERMIEYYPEIPAYRNYVAKVILLSAVFGTALIAIKPKTDKT